MIHSPVARSGFGVKFARSSGPLGAWLGAGGGRRLFGRRIAWLLIDYRQTAIGVNRVRAGAGRFPGVSFGYRLANQ
jgi:hypothetical protein